MYLHEHRTFLIMSLVTNIKAGINFLLSYINFSIY